MTLKFNEKKVNNCILFDIGFESKAYKEEGLLIFYKNYIFVFYLNKFNKKSKFQSLNLFFVYLYLIKIKNFIYLLKNFK